MAIDPDELDIDKHDPDEDGDTSPDVRNDPVPDEPAAQSAEEGDQA